MSSWSRGVSLRGHLWTIVPRLRHALWPAKPVGGIPWDAEVPDDRWGRVRVSGRLRAAEGARELVILVHGLGGCTGSHYIAPAADAVERAGLASLSLGLRGSDGSGEDIYHGGLTADLAAAAASRELAGYETLYAVGFSLGGHVALRYAVERPDRRLAAVAAICSPLNLAFSQEALDRPSGWLYRRYVLAHLRERYAPVARRRQMPVPLPRVLAAKSILEWDELTVVPRFGFSDAADYYRRASVAPRLGDLRVPSLLVAEGEDPMVPEESLRAVLARPVPRLDVRWVSTGGHVSFPRRLSLGVADAPRGLLPQVLGWLRSQR
jgi:predicted alpha/beta-fold hydrolase